MTGAVTVNVKSVVASSDPSLTVTVIVDEPVCPGPGVTEIVLLAPLPPNVMLALGTTVVLLEVALTVRLLVAVSASPIVKEIGPTGVSCNVDWSAIAEIVGGVFAGAVTVSVKSVEALSVPSVTVMVIVVDPV